MLIYFGTNETQFIFWNVVRGRVIALKGICANSKTKLLSKLCKSPLSDIPERLKVHHHNRVPARHGVIFRKWNGGSFKSLNLLI